MLRGFVHWPSDPGYAAATAMFNLGLVHRPEVVVEAESTSDVVAAIEHARANELRVSILGGGHGAYPPVTGGLMISTRRMRGVSIRGEIATVAAGERWEPVVERAAEHEMHPITGSSPHVGVVGYLLGGGLGPLARSHGFSSDWVTAFTVVTGGGAVLEVDREHEPDLFFALRGGKHGLGVVTEVRLRLAPLRSIYGGSLTFGAADAERVLRGWIDWTRGADPIVSTSLLLARLPPTHEQVAILRFAHPGDASQAEALARPLRALAEVRKDALGPMPVRDVAAIHGDPTEPVVAYTDAAMLAPIDHDFAAKLLAALPAESPFVGVELRHLGGATARDVPEGSAVGGRAASFALGAVAVGPEAPSRGPAASARLMRDLAPWLAVEGNANFLPAPHGTQELATAWSPATRARLDEIRRRYDPDGLFT